MNNKITELIKKYEDMALGCKKGFEQANKKAANWAERYGSRNLVTRSYKEMATSALIAQLTYESVVKDLKEI